MTKSIGLNTQAALSDARTRGLVIRDFVFVKAKNRSNGDTETVGFWNGKVPITAPVVKPDDGTSVNREYQAAGGLLSVQAIPGNMNLEVRTVRVRLSHLNEAALTALRTYDARMAEIEIHRGHFDPDTNQIVDPATCRFFGYINKAPIRKPKAGGEGYIEVECVSRSRIMTRTSGMLFSRETLKKRSGDLFGKFLDVAGMWRIWWGQDERELRDRHRKKKEKWFNPK